VRNAFAVLVIGASGPALVACGGGTHITVITGPTTTTIAHPNTGAIIRCRAFNTRLRAKVPSAGEVSKEVDENGSVHAIHLTLVRDQDGSVVVTCKG
jgi:hypothetical protein